MEQTLVAMVQAQSAVTALIGSDANARFYPVKLPQNPTYPACAYRIVGAPRDITYDGPDRVVTFRLQFDAYGATYAEAKALRDALEESLNGLNNTAFGSPPVKVKGMFLTNERDTYESTLDTTPNGGPFRKILEWAFTVQHPH